MSGGSGDIDYSDCFAMVVTTGGNITWTGSTTDNTLSYSKNNGKTWTTTNNTDDKEEYLQINVNVDAGNIIMWKGKATQMGSSDNYYNSFFSSSCKLNAYGNIMSLLYDDNFINETDLHNINGIFLKLFSAMYTSQGF